MTTITLSHFRDALLLARDEALHVLRLAMRTTTADDPDAAPAPTREARLAACAVLRLSIPDDEDADHPSDHPAPPSRPSHPSPPPHTNAPRSPSPAPTDAAEPLYPTPPPGDRLPSASPAAQTHEFSAPDDPLITGAILERHPHKPNTNASSPHSLLARAGAGPPSHHRR